ncbi:hypothetical protein UFOVP1244_63 [uncultured Caudovirales phage]|uniref:Phage P22-like portal protein n=1 Tax=uncultured Caudovirales phage TaxID=2100421 RepID=A0A6J5RLI2_9CAUD|nr:hypothetical protein UFOVP1244_63 [uncultured Caudovirales phage]
MAAKQKTDQEILDVAKENWRKAYSHWRKWRTEAKEDFGFVSGDQWDDNDKMSLDRQGRPAVVFNRIAPMIDAVSGSEVTNRQEIRFIPRELGDANVNEALTAAGKYFRDNCDAEDEESAAFFDCLVSGIGWTETRLDHDSDPDGQIVIERVDPFEVFVDPSASKGNFDDAKFVFRIKDLTKQEIESSWPGATDTFLPGSFTWGDVESEDDPHETIHGRQYELGKKGGGPKGRKKYRVCEYQWLESSPVYRMVDPVTGSDITFDDRRYQMLKKAFKAMGGDPPPAIRQKRMETRRAFFLGDKVLEEGPGPCRIGFTYRAITGKRDRNAGTWYGLVRPMKDPQRWSNKFFSQILHIINSNAKGGLLAEADAFEDVRDAETRWAEADSIIWMRPGGMGKVGPKPLAGVPPDVSSMMQFCVQSLREVTGINLELLGMAEESQPGILEYQRRQSGLMILATMFDSLRRYRKEAGRLLLYFIQEYIPEGRLIRIEGPYGAQFVPLMKQSDTSQYDVVVDEAPSSPNLKEQVFAVLQVLVPQLTAMGIQIPPDALDYLPLPDSLVQSIKTANAPQDGKQPPVDPAVQAMQQQIALDQQKAQADQQIAQQKMQADQTMAQQKLQSETQLKQSQIEADSMIAQQELQLKRQQADVDAQIAQGKLQLEQIKMQAMLNKVVPGATSDMEVGMQQLADTVAKNHENMQNVLSQFAQNHANMQDAIGSFSKHLQSNNDRQSQLSDYMNQMAGHLQASHQRQDQLHQAIADMQKSASAPREVMRDAQGRVSGVRIANGAAG